MGRGYTTNVQKKTKAVKEVKTWKNKKPL